MSEDICIYARDLDGTGSMHICSKEDHGAVKFIAEARIGELEADNARLLAVMREWQRKGMFCRGAQSYEDFGRFMVRQIALEIGRQTNE